MLDGVLLPVARVKTIFVPSGDQPGSRQLIALASENVRGRLARTGGRPASGSRTPCAMRRTRRRRKHERSLGRPRAKSAAPSCLGWSVECQGGSRSPARTWEVAELAPALPRTFEAMKIEVASAVAVWMRGTPKPCRHGLAPRGGNGPDRKAAEARRNSRGASCYSMKKQLRSIV